MTIKETFAKNLRSVLEDRGMRHKELAIKKIGNQATISKYLDSGNAQLPRADKLVYIAKELNVSTDWLLGLSQKQRIDDQLTFRDIGCVLIQCVNTPVLSLRVDKVTSKEFYRDDEIPETGDFKETVRTAISFSERLKDVDEYNPYADNYAPYGDVLNRFIEDIVTFHELYTEGRIDIDMYKRLLSTSLDRLGTESLPPSILDKIEDEADE